MYLLGIDIGTSSSKAVLTDPRGVIIASSSFDHQVSMPEPGYFEHDAERVWLRDLISLTASILRASAISADEISAIGISAISPAIVLIDAAGRPLRPGILYGIDTRATEEVKELSERFKDVNEHSRPFTSQSVVPKLLWLQRHEPKLWEQTNLVLGAEGYLVWKLTGQATLDVYDAAAYSPLFDEVTVQWDANFPDLCPISRLPQLAWSTEVVGRVTPEAAALTGLAAGTPVVAGTADAAAEATSCGLAERGDLMLMYGTSSFFILRSDHESYSNLFRSGYFLEKGSHVVTGGMTLAAGFAAWFSRVLGFEHESPTLDIQFEELMHGAERSGPGAFGLVALPYLAGERSPFFDPYARGGFLGLTLRHTQGDMYRAVLESIGYGLRRIFQELEADGFEIRRIFAVGGGTKNPLLMQLVCDIAGKDQIMPASASGAAHGSALRAGVGVGLFDDLSAAVSTAQYGPTIKANPTHKAIYDDMYGIYQNFYLETAMLVRELADVESRTRSQD